jgi:hypothetical protein
VLLHDALLEHDGVVLGHPAARLLLDAVVLCLPVVEDEVDRLLPDGREAVVWRDAVGVVSKKEKLCCSL